MSEGEIQKNIFIIIIIIISNVFFGEKFLVVVFFILETILSFSVLQRLTCVPVVFQRPLLAGGRGRLLPSSCGSVGAAVRPAFCPAGLGRPVVSEIGIEASWDT